MRSEPREGEECNFPWSHKSLMRRWLVAALVRDAVAGSAPTVVIGGIGKCGTNYLSFVLQRYGGTADSAPAACQLEQQRQGWCGEINWDCDADHWRGDGFSTYLQHFIDLAHPQEMVSWARKPPSRFPNLTFTFDKSTVYGQSVCVPLIFNALAPELKAFILLLCDPIVSVWSRLNHERAIAKDNTSLQMLTWVHALDSLRACVVKADASCGRLWAQPVVSQAKMMLGVPAAFASYGRTFGQRFLPLVSEKSKACPNYVSSAVSRALGVPTLPQENAKTRIHTTEGAGSSLKRESMGYAEMVAMLRPTFAPVYASLRNQMMPYGEDLSAWWNATGVYAVTSPPIVNAVSAATSSCARFGAGSDVGGRLVVRPEQSRRMQCGVFWFLHIPKTGGDSMKMALAAAAKKSSWTFVDLYQYPECDPLLASPNMSEWNRSVAWQRALEELRKPEPRLLVHQHHCSPGLGTYLLPQLNELKRELSLKSCSLVLTTVLREPVSRFVSAVYFNRVPYINMRGFVEHVSDEQVKYIMFGHERNWPPHLDTGLATPELAEEAAAVLSHFQLIGTTENLTSFSTSVQSVIGMTVQCCPYAHSGIPHPFNLTEEDLLWIRWHSMADEWLWNRMMHRYVV